MKKCNLVNKTLSSVHGKKSIILSIAGLFNTYLLSEKIINDNIAYLLGGIMVILGGGANYLNKKNGIKKNETNNK